MFKTKITTDLLKNIRECMKNKFIDAYIIPMQDAHDNEYIAECDKKVAYISGFTGSSGLAVITENNASLWTDGRYYEQASNQMDSNWGLMKIGVPNTPTYAQWLNSEIKTESKIGFYKYQLSMDLHNIIQESLLSNRNLTMLDECLVSKIWQNRPPRPANPLIILPESFTGKSWQDKIDIVRQRLVDEKVCGVFISALDEIAWLFNLRGSDISHNPVFFSFCFITDKQIHLFINDCVIASSPDLCNYLFDTCSQTKYQIKSHNYYDVDCILKEIVSDLNKVWVDPRTCYGLITAIPEQKRHLCLSPVSMLKAVKCSQEIDGMKQCNIDDSVALAQFFVWLGKKVEMNIKVTEAEAAEELDRLRSLLPGFYSLSFDTISCSGCNGGMIHYRAVKGQDAEISIKEMYLIDSGAQYLTGTTDVTRTVHFGQPTPEERFSYTLVLKGHIALASLKFPEGTFGSSIDSIARMPLWRHGLDYQHGTGHGVGAFLNVHEGPCGLSRSKNAKNEVGLLENMVLTIEPGFYKSQQYGIRIENDYYLSRSAVNESLSNPSVKFLQFESLTLFPIQMKLVELDMLTGPEIDWINAYHVETREKVGSALRMRGLIEESRWLMRETEPIGRSSVPA